MDSTATPQHRQAASFWRPLIPPTPGAGPRPPVPDRSDPRWLDARVEFDRLANRAQAIAVRVATEWDLIGRGKARHRGRLSVDEVKAEALVLLWDMLLRGLELHTLGVRVKYRLMALNLGILSWERHQRDRNRLGGKRLVPVHAIGEDDHPPEPPSRDTVNDLAIDLADALDALAEVQEATAETARRRIEGGRLEAIAGEQGVDVRTVSRRLRAAMGKLRRILIG